MNAELAPIALGKIDIVVARGLLDVRERHGTIGIGNVDNLIEARDRVPHMPRVSQWLFPLDVRLFQGFRPSPVASWPQAAGLQAVPGLA